MLYSTGHAPFRALEVEGMRWYVNVKGQSSGPWEDAEVLPRILSGEWSKGCQICAVGSKEWLEIASHPPFAAALREVAPPSIPTPRSVSAQTLPPRQTRSGMSPGFKLALWVIALIIFAPALRLIGALMGLALLAATELARRKNRASFVSWVLKRAPSQGQSFASFALGSVVLMLGMFTFGGDAIREKNAERAEQARQETLKREAAESSAKRAALVAELPAKTAAWRAKLLEVSQAADAPAFSLDAGRALKSVDAEVSASAALLGTSAPGEVGEVRAQIRATREKYEARAQFENSVQSVDKRVALAKEQAAAQQWLSADSSYEEALLLLDTINNAPESTRRFLPSDLNPTSKRKEVEALRARIASQVSKERREQEHQARMKRLEGITASLDSNSRKSYELAHSKLTEEIRACGRCQDAAKLAKAASSVNDELGRWPIEMSSVQELQNRYADMRGHRARIRGALSVSTYYNCDFKGQSRWRSLQLSDTLFGGMHVYCSRGDQGCESIFESLAAGGLKTGTAVVEYPEYNEVCEEDQAYLVGWTAN
jgi:hypothetical protein